MIKFIASTLLALILSQSVSYAQSGITALGIQSPKFHGINCHRFLQIQKASTEPVTAVLYKSFGKKNKCLKKFWIRTHKKSKLHHTIIYLSNESGRANSFLDKADFYRYDSTGKYNKRLEAIKPKTEAAIRKRVKRIAKLIAPYSYTGNWILSAGLEDRFTPKAFKNLYNVIKTEWPYEIARNSVKYTGKNIPSNLPNDAWYELHHYDSEPTSGGRSIINGDGQSLDFIDGWKLGGLEPASMQGAKEFGKRGIKSGSLVLYWSARWQGLNQSKPPKTLSRSFNISYKDVFTMKKIIKEIEK